MHIAVGQVKILQTVFDLMDYGGIVNYVEIMANAFVAMGHECEFVVLRNSTRDPYMIKPDTPTVGAYTSDVGTKAHVTQGWYGVQVFSYGNVEQRKKWRKYARKFDLVIHQIPNPKWDPDGHWMKLYDIEPPQIIATHDAHYRDLYPYLMDIADKVIAITAAQEAGFNALRWFPSRVAYMGCPIVPLNGDTQKSWTARRPRFVSAHVWKAWKRMDLVIRAIPRLRVAENYIAGDGIEGRYMRSVDKCKPKYEGIWQAALDADMHYAGFISPRVLQKVYQRSRVMVDVSWSKAHAALGNHFNYSTLESINNGCIPLVIAESMREVNKLKMFEADSTHFEVPFDITPKALAREIDRIVALPAKIARDINANGRAIVSKHHDAKRVCRWFIDLMAGSARAGIYRDDFRGHAPKQMRALRDAYIEKAEEKASR